MQHEVSHTPSFERAAAAAGKSVVVDRNVLRMRPLHLQTSSIRHRGRLRAEWHPGRMRQCPSLPVGLPLGLV